ncbi:hypothetical protein B0H19DRAFT_1383900 [Mycena capillaripes]|nr:hypothetical protein B0H19DRAFT_1383900 [Mycena capillaripes]
MLFSPSPSAPATSTPPATTTHELTPTSLDRLRYSYIGSPKMTDRSTHPGGSIFKSSKSLSFNASTIPDLTLPSSAIIAGHNLLATILIASERCATLMRVHATSAEMVAESPPPALVVNYPRINYCRLPPRRPNPLQDRLPQDRLRLQKNLPKTTPPLVKALNMQVGLRVFQSRRRQLWWSWFGGGGIIIPDSDGEEDPDFDLGLDIPEDGADGVEDKGEGTKPVKFGPKRTTKGKCRRIQGQADGQEDQRN